jgi:Icc-related predicted phosphoesterase
MRITFISDTHEQHSLCNLPGGDILIHCGDFTNFGDPQAVYDFDCWLREQDYQHRLVIPGNHDLTFDAPLEEQPILQHADLLMHEAVTIGGVRIFGSPHTPRFGDWAFMYDPARVNPWAAIPEVDVLVTHGPAFGVLDRTSRGINAGCVRLANAVCQTRPRVHAHGHIHEAAGEHRTEHTRTINCARMMRGVTITLGAV